MNAAPGGTPSSNDSGGELRDVTSPQPHSHGLPSLHSCYDAEYYALINPWHIQEGSGSDSGNSMSPRTAPSAFGLFNYPPGFRLGQIDASTRNVTPQGTVAPFQVLRTGWTVMDQNFPIYLGSLDVSSVEEVGNAEFDKARLEYDLTSPVSSAFPASESSATINSGDSDNFFGHTFNSTLLSSTASSDISKVESASTSPVPGLSDGFAPSWHSSTDVNSVASSEQIPGRAGVNHLPTRRRVPRPRRVAKTSHYAEDPDYEDPVEDYESNTAPTSAASQSPAISNDREHDHEEVEANGTVNTQLPNHRLKHETESAYRHRRDQYLLTMRERGISYRTIKHRGGFDEAESTLRGRWRALSKDKSERVRHPKWTAEDIKLLRAAVREHRKNGGRRAGKLPWKQIGLWIQEHGGTYCFAPATCSKKWEELHGRE